MNTKSNGSRYSYKLKARLKFKTKFKLWLRKIKISISHVLYKLRLRGNNFFSFLHIMLIVIILASTVGLALVISVIRANYMRKHEENDEAFLKKNVIVHYGDRDIKATVSNGILEDMLKDLNIEVDEDDEVFPDLLTPLKFVSECYIIKVDKEIVTKTLQIDFETVENIIEQESAIQRKVVRKGEKGEVLLKIELVYKNDILFSQTTIDKKVVKQPVDEIVDIYKTND